MRQDFFEYRPQFKITVIGNHKPVSRYVDDAARRRFNIVPFLHKPASPDPSLEEKLKAEWPAILRWMIDGCLEWQQHGLDRPQSVDDATREYFSDQDLVKLFLDQECDYEPGNVWKTATSAEIFAKWVEFCRAAGEQSGSQKSFSEALQRHGISKARMHGGSRIFKGVRLKPKPDIRQAGETESDFG